MRLAVIADIHGNALALERVLADIAGRGVERVVHLGDAVSGPLWPGATMALLEGRDWVTVRGNHDRWLAEGPVAMGGWERLAAAELDAGQRAWLGALPVMAEAGPGIVAFHASPGDDNRYLVEEVRDGHLVRAEAGEIARRLGGVAARVVLCGHSHLPQLVRLADGRLIVNPGSVGCPAYEDPGGPAPHVSEAGSPHARYAVLDIGPDRVDVEMIALDYGWEAAARQAERQGDADWARALRTGRVRTGRVRG